jgi:hypothetical protein
MVRYLRSGIPKQVLKDVETEEDCNAVANYCLRFIKFIRTGEIIHKSYGDIVINI